jgi:hypothetical protein
LLIKLMTAARGGGLTPNSLAAARHREQMAVEAITAAAALIQYRLYWYCPGQTQLP